MNRKKWQGAACFLLASLMMSSVFGAPVRKATPTPQATTMPKATTTPQETTMPKATPTPQETTMPKATPMPQATTMPKATPMPQATTMPKATTTPQATTMPKATPTPQATTMPKATESPKVVPICPKTTTEPKASEMPKSVPCPKSSEAPKKEVEPAKPGCPKEQQGEKNTEKQKPFTLDHFKMIINTLKKMGVEESKVVTYIKEGKKLEDILKAEKINTRKFKKCIIKEYFKVVDEAVGNGQITKEQAKQLKAAIKETICNWLPKK